MTLQSYYPLWTHTAFTRLVETEIVKTQLSTKGLAAAHFDPPDMLRQNVIRQMNKRLQLGNSRVNSDEDPAADGLKKTVTSVGDMKDKRVGVVAQADGVWRFAIIANGVWAGSKPVTGSLLGMEGQAGDLSSAGDLVKALMK